MATKTQVQLEKRSSTLWQVTLDNPPINLIDPETVEQLEAIVTELETDPEVCVVIFRSADPEFFVAHIDVAAKWTEAKPGKTGMHPWLDFLVRLSRAPVVSIAAIRGRARGAGSEFVLSCDIRFASLEKAILGQFEVGVGAVPGGNPMARLARLVGRGRALEIVLSAQDYSAELAERYGYVNRAVPDAEFEAFVDDFARRIAGFEKQTLVEAKAFVDRDTLPEDSEFPPALKAFFTSAARPETRARSKALMERGYQQRSDVELNLGAAVAEFRAK